jgi:hypothetical protein
MSITLTDSRLTIDRGNVECLLLSIGPIDFERIEMIGLS